MDCPNCGVYNPEERTVCWRCDKELPKPKPTKKKDPASGMRRMWIIIGIILVVWIVITWVVPILTGGGGVPLP
jgi:hypothetical protein